MQVNDFDCLCPDGYEGKDCGHDIDDCASNPCFAGSTCIDGIAEYKCSCINGMTGKNCEIDIGKRWKYKIHLIWIQMFCH